METYLKAIADNTRLRIAFLLTFGELCICDLQKILKLPQTTISRHMQYMKKHDFVLDEKRGRWIYYRLKPASNTFHAALLKAVAQILRDEPAYQKLITELHDYLITRTCE